MPLTAVDITTVVRWALEKPVTGWPSVRQGENVLTNTLQGLDVATWDEVYDSKVTLAGGANTTIDLTAVTNLAGESVAFAHVFALALYVAATVPASANCPVTLAPGAANGLQWFYGTGLVLQAGEHVVKSAAVGFAGVVVDGTHKTIKLSNGGGDSADVTLAILGRTT